MKASEVLRRYQAGQRNFQRVNLRGQSFQAQNLSGADFSEADLRSTNFTGANLTGAKFCGAECGLQRRWVIFLLILSWLLVGGVVEVVEEVVGVAVGRLVGVVEIVLGTVVEIVLGVVAGIVVAVAERLVGVVAIGRGGGEVIVGGEIDVLKVGGRLVAVIVMLIGAFVGVIVIAIAAVVVGGSVEQGLVMALFVMGGGWGVLIGISNNPLAIAFAATGGTSFRGADLTEANFTGARLKSTDFREANLTHVRWYGAKMLSLVRPGNTYLQDERLQEWLRGEGTDKDFDGKDLQGVNLQGANLADASFIGANLREAYLRDTDLSRAKLIETKLDGADLTGASIQNWMLDSETNLKNVICDYIYLKEERQERRPAAPNQNLAPGELAKLVEQSRHTVDLIFKDGIDWKAFLSSYQNIQVQYGEQNVSIQAIEKNSDGAFVIRVSVPPDADKAQIEIKAKQSYETQLKVLEAENNSWLRENANLNNIVQTLAIRPIIVSQVQGNNRAGERQIEISGGTLNASGAGAFSLGDIYGTVANKIEELPSSSNPNESGIKELLTQLKESLDDPDLSEPKKKSALDQVNTLAEAGKNPKDATMKEKAEMAVGFLEVIAKGVEPATLFAQTCTKVLPKILLFFGL